jgi:hypothetical protein
MLGAGGGMTFDGGGAMPRGASSVCQSASVNWSWRMTRNAAARAITQQSNASLRR